MLSNISWVSEKAKIKIFNINVLKDVMFFFYTYTGTDLKNLEAKRINRFWKSRLCLVAVFKFTVILPSI